MQPHVATPAQARGRLAKLVPGVVTAAVLLAVPFLAVVHLGFGIPSPGADPSGTEVADTPLTFDAPSATAAKFAAQQKKVSHAVAQATTPAQEEVTVLEDWQYTQTEF